MSRFWAFLQACIFSLFLIMAICGFILGYIWRDGLMDPDESQEAVNQVLSFLGPWAFAIDVFFLSPLIWWLARSTVWKPIVKEVPPLPTDIVIPSMIDLPPIFLPPPYSDPNQDMWEEMLLKNENL